MSPARFAAYRRRRELASRMPYWLAFAGMCVLGWLAWRLRCAWLGECLPLALIPLPWMFPGRRMVRPPRGRVAVTNGRIVVRLGEATTEVPIEAVGAGVYWWDGAWEETADLSGVLELRVNGAVLRIPDSADGFRNVLEALEARIHVVRIELDA